MISVYLLLDLSVSHTQNANKVEIYVYKMIIICMKCK